jgi:FKBP-type peptidyl-prolyl cis-trans isomerase (trigger factor)
VLSKFADAENITVTDEDVTAEVQTMVQGAGEQLDAMMRLFNTENARDTIRRSLLTRRTLERLAAVAGGEPGTVAVKAKAPAKPARRAASKKPRSGPRDTDVKETDTEEESKDRTE